MTTLFHWTDELGKKSIQESGLIQPNGPLDLVWLTSHGHRSATSIGFDPAVEHWRFEVAPGQEVEPWLEVQKNYDITSWLDYELADQAKPETWWVAWKPVKVMTVQ